jgi:hypothetical protein
VSSASRSAVRAIAQGFRRDGLDAEPIARAVLRTAISICLAGADRNLTDASAERYINALMAQLAPVLAPQ